MRNAADKRLTLSVVIPTKNSASTIGQCLDSLMPYYRRGDITEIAVVDGHSRDGTVEIVQRYPVKFLHRNDEVYRDSVIRGWREILGGLEIGWRSCSGDLVMFLDSDAHLGECFFPEALGLFDDEELGVLGCWPKAWVTTRLTETMGQLWFFHGERIRSIQKGSTGRRLSELPYTLVAAYGATRHFASGPCYIVRRSCLELVGGHSISGDMGISARLDARGWRSSWWVDAPVYHLPRESLKGLWRQRYFWGQYMAYTPTGLRTLLLSPFRLGGAMALGVFLAVRFRNVLQLVALPLTQVALLAGCMAGLWARARGRD